MMTQRIVWGRVFFAVVVGCHLGVCFAPLPEWQEWRAERLIQAVQQGNVAQAYVLLELGANAKQNVYVNLPWECGATQDPRLLTQSNSRYTSQYLPLMCYAIKHAPPKRRAALAFVLLSHGANANDPGTARGEIYEYVHVARTPLERAQHARTGDATLTEDENTALFLQAYGAK